MSMLSFLRFLGKRRRSGRLAGEAKKARPRQPLLVESLEARELLAGDTPFIKAVTPPDGSLQASAHPTITVQFSEAMKPGEISNPLNYLLVNASGAPVSIQTATPNATNDTVTLSYNGSPANPLPVNNYTLFVHGDQVHDADDNRALAGPGQLIVANSGGNNASTVNLPGDGTLGALGQYGVPPVGATAANPVAVQLADLNGDNVPDLIVVDSGTNQVAIFKGRAPAVGGGFSQTPDLTLDLPAGAAPKAGALIVRDLHDLVTTVNPVLDIAVANAGTNNVSVFLNNRNPAVLGSLSFAPAVNSPLPAGVTPVGLIAADLDGDGYLDLATANSVATGANYTVSVLQNKGATAPGTFPTAATNFTVGTTGAPSVGVIVPTGLAAGILSTSGLTDLAVSGGNGNIGYLRNTTVATTLTFAGSVAIPTGVTTTSVAIGKVHASNPTVADIVATTSANNGQALVFTSSGAFNPTFALAATLAAGTNPTGVTLADVDGNGLNDILVANNNATGSVTVLLNTSIVGAVSFATPFPYATDANPQGLAVVDTAGDGRPDLLATANSSANDVSLLANTETPGPFTGAISNVVNTPSGILITSTNTLTENSIVTIRGVQGDTAANGTFKATSVTPFTFTLQGIVGNGTYTGGGVWISPNDLFRVSGDVPIGGTTPTPDAVTIGDLNGDGLPDYVVANKNGNTISVFLSTGQVNTATGRPLYLSPLTFNTGNTPVSVAVGDVNGDGKADIVVANQADSTVTVFTNNGNGTAYTSSTIAVGSTPTQVVLGDFLHRGLLDLAVAHNSGAAKPQGVTVVLNNGSAGANLTAPFNGQTGVEYAVGTPASAIAVGDLNNDGNLDFVVASDSAPGKVLLFLGNGAGGFSSGGTFASGVINPSSIAIADMNLDGYADIVVASKSTGATTGGVAVLLNQLGTGFAPAVVTPVLPGTGLGSLVVTNVNQAVPGAATPDVFPDVIVAALPPAGAGIPQIDNVFTLAGNGDGTFQAPTPYQVGGPGTIQAPSFLAATPSPLVRITTFTSGGNLIVGNLVSNSSFEARDLSGEQGNLLGWQTYDLPNSPGSHGRWNAQTGSTSPLSMTPVTPPAQGNFQAMLDEANLVPPQGGNNPNPAPSYSGSHALYQDIAIPAGATTVTLTFHLYIDDSGAGGYNNFNSISPTPLDWQFNSGTPNQQFRVDLLNPSNANQDPNNPTGTFLGVTSATGVLLKDTGGHAIPLFVTGTNIGMPNTITTFNASALINGTFTFDLTPYNFGGATIRLRFGETNNQGKMVVGVDNVKVTATFTDTTPPLFTSVGMRNPGFLGAPGTTTPHTTDSTVAGRVTVNGGVNNLAYIAFDPNNDGTFNGPDDFKTATVDALGNFSFTVPGLLPGLHTVGVQAVDKAGQAVATTVTFFLESNNSGNWRAYGPDAIDTTGQGVDYTTVSGRITSVATDPTDLSGNTYYVGSANGGVWKTIDGGSSWKPLMDYLTDGLGNPVPAPIGAVGVGVDRTVPTSPTAVLYAGTGVADTAFDSRAGVGVFRSTDGGKNWVLAGDSATSLAGARISKIVVDSTNPNIVYAAVASGGASGPGVYRLINNATNTGAWIDILTPTSMSLPVGTALASVTDLVIDPFNSSEVLAGLGNIGLVAPSSTAGLWVTSNANSGGNWNKSTGGAPETIGGVSVAVPASTLPGGLNVGRVTVAIGTGRLGDEATVYVLIGSPPPAGGNVPPNVDLGSGVSPPPPPNAPGLYKTSGNTLFLDYTKVMLRQDTSALVTHSFQDIDLLGRDASYVGAMVVDPTDPNVVYIGGSTLWTKVGDPPAHALVRVDTGDMRDANYSPVPGVVVPPNDGDDIQKALKAVGQGGNYAPGDAYTGEGVYWYDLVQKSSATTGTAKSLPPEIHALAIDHQGRLLIGTEGGLWRAVNYGYGYDFTSGARGILKGTSFTAPAPSLTSLNGNLQIADLTSAAIDPHTPNVLYTTQAGTGAAASSLPLQWVSQGLTGPTFPPVAPSTTPTNLGIPTADVVLTATPAPGTPPGSPTTLYRLWQFANPQALLPETSTDGGVTYTPVTSNGLPPYSTTPPFINNAGKFPALAVNPVPVFDPAHTVFVTQLLFGTDQVFITSTSSNTWLPVGLANTPLSATGGLITTLSIFPDTRANPPGIYYAGTDKGEVFVTFNGGGDFWGGGAAGGLNRGPVAMAGFRVNGITVDASDPTGKTAYALFASFGGNAVWRTIDGGANWANISAGLPAVPAYALAVDPSTLGGFPNGHLYVATDVAVFSSGDQGGTWQSMGQGLPHVPVVGLTFDPNQQLLAAATQGRGVFTISTDHMGPRVTSLGFLLGQASIRVTFSEAIDPTTFTLATIGLAGPGGPVAPTGIVNADPTNNNNFLITFNGATSAPGSYTLTIQPTVTDTASNQMDQNQNFINGEIPGDVYTGRFLWQPTAINTAPSLGAPLLVAAPPVRENDVTNTGFDLASFVAGLNITDPDPGAVKGLAINAADSTNGTWQYSRDSGTTWTAFAPTANASLLLQAVGNNRLRFIPATNFFGGSSFTFRAWDLTTDLSALDGSDGTTAPSVPNGGATAYSVNQGTASLTVLFVNHAPSFNVGPNVTVLENSGANGVKNWATNLSAGPPNEAGQALDFQVTGDSNVGLFSAAPTLDAAGNLFFTPALNASGSAVITVQLHDNGGTANGGQDTSAPQQFLISVTPVNQPPSFSAGPNVSALENSGAYTAAWATNLAAGPPNEAGQALNFQVTGDSNPGLFSVAPSVDPNGQLSFTPATNAVGSAVITVQLHDNGGTANGGQDTSAPQQFTITLIPVNQAPSFTPGPDVTAVENGGAQSQPWATNISAGPANEAGQQFNFHVSNNNNGLFTVQPSIDPSGTLTFTPAPNAVGSAVVTVQLQDNGGTANGGHDTSTVVQFTLTIIPINQAPSFARGPDQNVGRDAGAIVVPGWATHIVAGQPNEAGQTLNFIVSNNNPGLFSTQPAISPNGTLTYTPSGAGGSALVTVLLHDNGGTANGGSDTSAPQQFTISISGSSFIGTPNEVWVIQTYLDLLNRTISPGDLAFWTDKLEADVPRLTIATTIVNSLEYRTKYVIHLYQTLLDKVPAAGDLLPHLRYLGQGHTLEELRAVFLSSPTYIHGHGRSNEFAWVNAVFQDELGHAADLPGQQYWVTQLHNSGFDFFHTALAIEQTPEGYGELVRQGYITLLGRPVDPKDGVNPYFAALQTGARDEDVFAGIVSSDEYFARLRPRHNVPALQSWVGHTYQDVLGHLPNTSALGFWTNTLQRGASRIDIMQQIVNSTEYRTKLINDTYSQLLHHPAGPNGVNLGLQLLGGGGTVEQLKASLMGSSEYYFVRGGGTDGGFVTAALSDALSSTPAQVQGGVPFWGAVLANDTRTDVALQILQDINAEKALVQNLYLALLRRGGGGGLDFWANEILAGQRDEDVVAGLTASREYYTRFSNG